MSTSPDARIEPATERTIREFLRVLQPGGTAIVMVHHRASLNFHVSLMLVRRALAYTADGMRAALAGFANVQTDVRFLNLRAYRFGKRFERTRWARRLGSRVGWHLWIRATKGAS
jgi:hypothetical protein